MLSLAPRTLPTVDEILEMSRDLPSSARMLPKLQQLLRDPQTSTADVIDLLRLDPTLTARTVGMANRAFMGAGEACTTLDEAVQRLGFDEVFRIVATVAARSVFCQEMPLYGYAEGELMARSLSAAILMPLLNTIVDLPMSGDQLYTIGLLHGLGQLALNRYAVMTGTRKRLRRLSLRDQVAVEKRIFGHGHPALGAAMMEEWGFAPRLVEAVRGQASRHPGGDPVAADLLRLSVSLSGFVRNRERTIRMALKEPALRECPIPGESLLYLVDRAREVYEIFQR